MHSFIDYSSFFSITDVHSRWRKSTECEKYVTHRFAVVLDPSVFAEEGRW